MRKFGLIGKTLGHSFSKTYFENKFQEDNITNCSYDNYELDDIKEIKNLLENNPEIEGLNITLPYKETVIEFLDEIDESVKETGACNCIKITEGKLIGYNTDKLGFLEAFISVMTMDSHKVMILGNGGASKAVTAALDELSLDYTVYARNPKNTYEKAWAELEIKSFVEYYAVINTTPVGMFPNIDNCPDIPYKGFTNKHLAFDLIYNPEKTKFLEKANNQGADIENGKYMLELQADRAWDIFNS